VEEKLIALQASKRLMSQQAMGSSDGSSTDSNSLGADTGKGNRLSLEELKNLFL
jgi:SNF2 family DNA or RNA helicase